MFYSLVGRLVWHGLKSYLRLKYGRTYVPKSVLAGGTIAIAIAVSAAAARANRAPES